MKPAESTDRVEPSFGPANQPEILPAGDELAEVAAGLSLPPAAGYDLKESERPVPVQPTQLQARVETVRQGLWWLVHVTLSIGYLGLCLLLCGLMAFWYFEMTFEWGALCCGKADKLLDQYLVLQWSVKDLIGGVPLWQIGAVVLAAAATIKILIEKVKRRYSPEDGQRRGGMRASNGA